MIQTNSAAERSVKSSADKVYFTYIIRCSDGSLYTGITTDIKRRMSEHLSKGSKSAKYTKSHTAKKTEAVWECQSKSLASKLEYRIKRLKKQEKEYLISENDFSVFKEKVDQTDYSRL
ncbi:MAG: GIY-YIG nuclease family protein [Clostridia bacterium]|nr:GIY-YIG nuclease family protein [Clostridia bacterium]